MPFHGCAWFLDELLYGGRLSGESVEAPLIEISAGRSGSTQIARYLESDPELVAPNLLQIMIPYLWAWKLARRFLNRDSVREKARAKITAMMPPEAVERHELDPFRTDTFDGALYSFHLNHLAPSLGPQTMIEDFNFAKSAAHNKELWEETFVALTDRIARKTLLFARDTREETPLRFFVKGHFLCGAEALKRKYPDAVFLTVIREPAPRFKSAINYLRVNPSDPMLGPVPWSWLTKAILRTETDYCEVEKEWFGKQDGANRCVIRFASFVEDLEGTMAKVYRDCLGRDTVPRHVPTAHPLRERQHYSVDRSLAELGISETELNVRLTAYHEWCQQDS
ncbi:MAG: sulfotransferase [Verrucomicrobiota bacterium]